LLLLLLLLLLVLPRGRAGIRPAGLFRLLREARANGLVMLM
jgi:hypothetical protein